MTDTTKFKNVSLSKKTYGEVGLLSKEYLMFDYLYQRQLNT